MIFGLDVFAKVEFAHVIDIERTVWNEVCDHNEGNWVKAIEEGSSWQAAEAGSVEWSPLTKGSAGWIEAQDEDADWEVIESEIGSITRC